MAPRPRPVMQRILERTEIADSGHDTPCWVWMGALNAAGYGWVNRDGKPDRAHRIAYLELVGPIPVGLELDHLCRVRSCWNPDHLEPVTHAENMRRGCRATVTHCPQNHPYDEANTYISSRGSRICRKCRNAGCERLRKARLRKAKRANEPADA